MSGLPGRWFTCPATPPLGNVRPPHTADSGVGAYGDSALVEAFGLGALAHAYAPDMQALHKDFYHPDLLALPATLLLREHPALPRLAGTLRPVRTTRVGHRRNARGGARHRAQGRHRRRPGRGALPARDGPFSRGVRGPRRCAAEAVTAISGAPGRATALRIFIPFAAGFFFSYLVRNVNAVIAPDLTQALSLSAATLGLLTSAYFLTFAAFQLPLGVLLDRFGPRTWSRCCCSSPGPAACGSPSATT